MREELLTTCVIPSLNYSLFSLHINLSLNTYAIDNDHRQVSDKERYVRIINVERALFSLILINPFS